MPFTPKSWGNFSTGGTPLTAAALIDLETRLAAYTDAASGSGLGIFNVEAYGAVGDGVTNDTTPIANAIAAADVVNGIVWFPPGTYAANMNVPDGVSIWGSGPRTSTLLGVVTSIGSHTQYRDIKIGKTNARCGFSASATDILFENCWLFGGTNEATIYLNDNSTTNMRFVGCELSGNTSGGNAVQIVDKGTVAKHFEDIIFTRCWFHGNDRMNFECIQRNDVGFPVITGYRNISLLDCIIDGNSSNINVSYDGGTLDDGSVRSSGYSMMRGCKVTGGVACLELAGPTDMRIEDNEIRTPTGGGDIISMSQYGTATTEKHIAVITGNRLYGPGNVVLAGEGVSFVGNDMQTSGSLRLAACDFSTITGNEIETTGFTAVSVENSARNIFTGNHVRGGLDQTFLFIFANSDDNLVDSNIIESPNVIFDVRDGTTQNYGKNIHLEGGTWRVEERSQDAYSVPYSASMTFDSASIYQRVVVTNTTPMTINAPAISRYGTSMTVDFLNSSGGAMGPVTWNAVFKLAGPFVNPASTKHRTISFFYDNTSWIETSRAAADI